MKQFISPAVLVIASTIMLLGALYLSGENKSQREKIQFLEIEVINLNDRNYNDSVLLSEYQAGLDSFMTTNPKAADEFMKLIEHQFE